jgi:solute carrier family 27 fatty acid transporter 1/4
MVFQETAQRNPNKVAFYFKDTSMTFSQLDQYSNRVANCFTKLGFVAEDEVALMMENKPEFVGLWLGLAKCGIRTLFINTNHKSDTLIQSLQVVKCKAIIFDSQFTKSKLL